MNLWLCIASDYQQIHVALCNEDTIIAQQSVDKKNSNQQLLLTIDTLLKNNNSQLKDMMFIGVNLGPAPYTGLRIAIATVNGLHTATHIPLVGIDALHTFVGKHLPNEEKTTTVVLLNAFNFDIFYAIAPYGETIKSGYENIDTFLNNIKELPAQDRITFIGNGTELYAKNIKQILGNKATITDRSPYPLIDQLVQSGWQNWQENKIIELALPLYLKQLAYKNSINVK
ncbi:MAG: tRNA (adenosine(37)-N6)-threonylcarbamoyltransferase complex dimerization subunit type 1 TsaB [Candidatus Dependentiae bacterium]